MIEVKKLIFQYRLASELIVSANQIIKEFKFSTIDVRIFNKTE
jgi:hypothetical protein